ncbi:MAG: helix-turn-helix domain-containing protein [Flavobacteriales bacterium]|nr:helix-turn-helix domain-containing protein [Flavobacteriales bacterium]
MWFDLWSGILIASGVQCLLLILILFVKPNSNKTSRFILALLLLIVLAINVSNYISATYLYREVPQIAGFARGMVLLLGPLIYLYIRSLIVANFKLKLVHLLHLTPYLLAWIIIQTERSQVSTENYITMVDWLMEGKAPMSWLSTIWFVSYFIHLSVYFLLLHRFLKKAVHENVIYLVPLDARIKWAKRLLIILSVISLLFLGISSYSFISGLYTINGNFLYTLILAIAVYIIAYQGIFSRDLLTPDFVQKYGKTNTPKETFSQLKIDFNRLFEEEKIFTQSDLKVGTVADLLKIPAHQLSRFINTEFNQTFTELLNQYRIEEFKQLVTKQRHKNLSIMGLAYEVGYNSKSTFNTAFKKQTGLTPSAYIKKTEAM